MQRNQPGKYNTTKINRQKSAVAFFCPAFPAFRLIIILVGPFLGIFFFYFTLLLFIESSCIRTNNKFKNLNYNKYFLNSCIIFPTVLCLNGPNNLFAGLVGPFAGDGNGC